jgi:hypothetical protein
VANTLYHATNWADSRYEPGAPCQWETRARFGNFPITFVFGKAFREFLQARAESNARRLVAPVAVPYVKTAGRDYQFDPHYTVTGFECKQWHEAPFKSLAEAREFCAAINGHELTFEKIPTKYAGTKERNLKARAELQKALEDRLPELMKRFRLAIENEAGFQYEAPEGLNV